MKKNNKAIKIILIILSLVILTGCTKTLTDENKKAVKYEETGKALTENVLCKNTDEKVIELYKENEPVDILTVAEALKKRKSLESVGGRAYLAMLTAAVISTANI